MLIHHRQHAQVTAYVTSTLCGKYTGVIGKQKQQQQNEDEGGFPGDSPLDRMFSARVERDLSKIAIALVF